MRAIARGPLLKNGTGDASRCHGNFLVLLFLAILSPGFIAWLPISYHYMEPTILVLICSGFDTPKTARAPWCVSFIISDRKSPSYTLPRNILLSLRPQSPPDALSRRIPRRSCT